MCLVVVFLNNRESTNPGSILTYLKIDIDICIVLCLDMLNFNFLFRTLSTKHNEQ